MTGYIGLTDFEWFDFLRKQRGIDDVNFWRPSARQAFAAIPRGQPYFFQLKSPHYKIGGFGVFDGYAKMPLWSAWEAFGIANGAPDRESFFRLIARYAAARFPAGKASTYEIGCIMITQPIFFEDDELVDIPRTWKRNIVQGAGINVLNDSEGRRIWAECLDRARARRLPDKTGRVDLTPRYGEAYLARPRLGQGTFRFHVSRAYEGACAVTGEHSGPVLEAAHIKPYSEEGVHEVSNGLLLRSDIHRLFDGGYTTVTSDFRFLVSKRLKQEYANGKTYYPLHGQRIALPQADADRPTKALLEWHNRERFLG